MEQENGPSGALEIWVTDVGHFGRSMNFAGKDASTVASIAWSSIIGFVRRGEDAEDIFILQNGGNLHVRSDDLELIDRIENDLTDILTNSVNLSRLT